MISLRPKLNNYLWISRTRLGLTRKRLTALIGHETTSQLSRWEDGVQLPSLANALMLGYLLERPVEELFVSAREDVIRQVEARKKAADANDGEEADEKARGGTASLPFRTSPPVRTPDIRRAGAGCGSR